MEVHFTPEVEKKLTDIAAQRGQGADEFVRDFVSSSVDELANPEVKTEDRRPLQSAADSVLKRMRNVPPEIMAAMPKDGASQHDHYIYGWPKKEA
jgi:hypothetical protein